MTQSPRGAAYAGATQPPPMVEQSMVQQQQKISAEQLREQKLANLHKLGSMIGIKNEPQMNEQPPTQSAPQQQMMMPYGGGGGGNFAPPQQQMQPPFPIPNMIRTPQGLMPLRPGMMFVAPNGQPLLMTFRGPVPHTPEEQARFNWEMARMQEHEMQQSKHPRMPAAAAQQRSQRIPASVKPTMSVPPNARQQQQQQRMQQQQPPPENGGYTRATGAPPGMEYGGMGSPYAPHFAPDADAYAKDYMQRSAQPPPQQPRHEQYAPPPPHAQQPPPQHATVNNTYVNANLSIQQLNIQVWSYLIQTDLA